MEYKKQYVIRYSDLGSDTRERIETDLKEYLMGEWKQEGETFLKKPEYAGKTWQEAIMREYSFNYILWQNDEDAKTFDWKANLELVAEEQALQLAEESNKRIEINVTANI